jgi:hypothetical protein
MRSYIRAFMLATSLGLASCGGGNDVASSGASAVSAAAPTPDASPSSAPSTTSVATQTTEPKVNGQIDERTGVAPVVAALTAWSPTANGGCGNSSSFYGFVGNGPVLTNAQFNACTTALGNASTYPQCMALGGLWDSKWLFCFK